jgi:hypothetical protein
VSSVPSVHHFFVAASLDTRTVASCWIDSA